MNKKSRVLNTSAHVENLYGPQHASKVFRVPQHTSGVLWPPTHVSNTSATKVLPFSFLRTSPWMAPSVDRDQWWVWHLRHCPHHNRPLMHGVRGTRSLCVSFGNSGRDLQLMIVRCCKGKRNFSKTHFSGGLIIAGGLYSSSALWVSENNWRNDF